MIVFAVVFSLSVVVFATTFVLIKAAGPAIEEEKPLATAMSSILLVSLALSIFSGCALVLMLAQSLLGI